MSWENMLCHSRPSHRYSSAMTGGTIRLLDLTQVSLWASPRFILPKQPSVWGGSASQICARASAWRCLRLWTRSSGRRYGGRLPTETFHVYQSLSVCSTCSVGLLRELFSSSRGGCETLDTVREDFEKSLMKMAGSAGADLHGFLFGVQKMLSRSPGRRFGHSTRGSIRGEEGVRWPACWKLDSRSPDFIAGGKSGLFHLE